MRGLDTARPADGYGLRPSRVSSQNSEAFHAEPLSFTPGSAAILATAVVFICECPSTVSQQVRRVPVHQWAGKGNRMSTSGVLHKEKAQGLCSASHRLVPHPPPFSRLDIRRMRMSAATADALRWLSSQRVRSDVAVGMFRTV
ncbi:hypothetical protein SKAU_G00292910 [Synaphobranchus kaupii]|uniref:Uncharacterized protein n=1 Tax=Synaphobranchus kaupii TaxID=118154 RepID=A0A9Q1EU63_SYNKA|nr:hypothetical protein SKAU_G00292910 [Synaphobranchus kaupii]